MQLSKTFENNQVNMAEIILSPSKLRGQDHDAAIICDDEIVNYSQLWSRVNQAGNAFLKINISIGDRVIIMVRDTPAFFYVYLGLLKIGAIPIAINLRLNPDDVAYTMNDSKAKAIVLDDVFLSGYRGIAKDISLRPKIINTDVEHGDLYYLPKIMGVASHQLDAVKLKPEDPAFWMYSSGTTGRPKGVVHSQKSILAADHLMGEILGVGPGDRIYGSSKLFFAFSLAHCFLASIRLGATTILYPEWPDAEAVANVVQQHKPTIFLSVPTFYRNMLREGVANKSQFKNVRHYITAGEKLPSTLFARWVEVTGHPILEGIGATETCFLFLANRPDKIISGTCGLPTPETKVKLIDGSGEVITKSNTPGILWVKMECVASGYWNMKKRTREVFKDGWYCTNDMFMFDDLGYYEYQGRIDDILKISGQWVSPAEIEAEVLKNKAVTEAAIVGVPNEDGLIRLALFIVTPKLAVPKEDFEKQLIASLRANLSIYKCPRSIYYLDEMPLTATGKLQRFVLRDKAESSQKAKILE
ncbi:MAG: benzoate-CoA ligase family protein [Pseudomonadota bacterium]|nr:benzoate-CoA ligase family protein [Pseudomonadota bacterium]